MAILVLQVILLILWFSDFTEKTECRKLSSQPSMCFSFKIDDADADGYDVSTAVLWLFKNTPKKLLQRNDTLLTQQTIVVSEVQQQLDSKYIPVIKTIAIQSVDVQGKNYAMNFKLRIKKACFLFLLSLTK